MATLIESLRSIIGSPQWYLADGSLDYGAVCEYMVCSLIILVTIASVFKFLLNLLK